MPSTWTTSPGLVSTLWAISSEGLSGSLSSWRVVMVAAEKVGSSMPDNDSASSLPGSVFLRLKKLNMVTPNAAPSCC